MQRSAVHVVGTELYNKHAINRSVGPRMNSDYWLLRRLSLYTIDVWRGCYSSHSIIDSAGCGMSINMNPEKLGSWRHKLELGWRPVFMKREPVNKTNRSFHPVRLNTWTFMQIPDRIAHMRAVDVQNRYMFRSKMSANKTNFLGKK